MIPNWTTITLDSEVAAFDMLLDLRGKQWLSRGQSEPYGVLIPSIDRGKLASLTRQEKLAQERSSIDLFRATARFFAAAGEQNALTDDFVALMVLRHYSVKTRLLDWSGSPYVAAYFAVHDQDTQDGELWSFDRVRYEEMGKEQWQRWPETTTDRSGDPSKFAAGLTAFITDDDPPDWVIAAFYPVGFPRQDAQSGAYTVTARFDRDHADALQSLLNDPSKQCRCVIPAKLKPTMRQILREKHGVWRGALFPDSAGAAETAASAFQRCGGRQKPSMSFDQDKFLDEHIRYRLTHLDVFDCALEIVSTHPKPDSRVQIVFDTGHTLNGSYGIFTNPAVETGLIACRMLLEFLEAKQSSHDDDVFITMFQRPNGENLSPVPLSVVAEFHPSEVSRNETLEALKFTKRAADKAVAHLTLGPPDQRGKEIQLYRISCLAIRAAIEHHLYEKLGLPTPRKRPLVT